MFILDLKGFNCYSMKLSLKRILKYSLENNRTAISMLNRQKNKPVFLRNVKNLLMSQQLNLFEISKIFMKVNNVYKQASIERQSIRKRVPINRRSDS